ncbi:MAG TPA: OB-fold nucleic acid binding domain-containing protein, partial [Bacteroidia bacterium]|nr:OB-fold nucleic acid binding domain-containing protein [Bacteroidia bacterium]
KITFFMEECKRMGIKVLGPDVNEGFGKFSVNPNGDVRFGMASIKGVGENVINTLVTEREANGKFTSVFDLAKRLDSKAINKKSIEGLALAGAMDSFEGVHRAMFFVPEGGDGTTLTDRMIKYGNQMNNGTDTSQASLFGGEDEIEITEPQLPKVEPWNSLEQLAREKEVVGFFISGHPLDPYKLEIEHLCKANCAQLKAGLEPFKNKEVTIAGIVVNTETRTSKTGNQFGKIVIEDYHGAFDIMLFGKDFVEYSKFMVPQLFIFVKARVQERYNQPGSLELKVQKIELLDEIKQKAFSHLKLKIDVNNLTDELISNLENLFRQFEGKSNVEFYVEDPNENISIKLHSKGYKVAISNDLMFELERMGNVACELN